MTVPKARLETDDVRGETPTPVTPKVSGLTVVLSVSETAPLMVPFEEGLNGGLLLRFVDRYQHLTPPHPIALMHIHASDRAHDLAGQLR